MPREFYVELTWKCANAHSNEGHLKVCHVCGAPKTDVEGDIDDGSLTPVVDPKLAKQAAAGEDWSCQYCGAAERRDDGECVRCGVSQQQGEKRPVTKSSFTAEAPTKPEGWKQRSIPPLQYTKRRRSLPFWLIAAPVIVAIVIGLFFLLKPLDLHGKVTALAWQRTIHIDRYSLQHDSGFTLPSGALNVANDGQRQNGWNYHVLIGHHRVTDAALCGTKNCRTQTYGCVTPQPVCVKQNNGFKKCTQGDPVCQTSTTCDPKTCDVSDYADLPIYATFYEWDFWGWSHNRDALANGTTADVRWPDTTPPPLQDGEQERESGREESYTVTFTGRKGDSWSYTPKGYSEFETYQLGSRHKIRVVLGSVSTVFD